MRRSSSGIRSFWVDGPRLPHGFAEDGGVEGGFRS